MPILRPRETYQPNSQPNINPNANTDPQAVAQANALCEQIMATLERMIACFGQWKQDMARLKKTDIGMRDELQVGNRGAKGKIVKREVREKMNGKKRRGKSRGDVRDGGCTRELRRSTRLKGSRN